MREDGNEISDLRGRHVNSNLNSHLSHRKNRLDAQVKAHPDLRDELLHIEVPERVLHLDAVLLPNEIEIVAGLLLPQPAIAVHIFTVQQVLASGERSHD